MRYDRSINFHAILGLWEMESFDILRRVLIRGKRLKENMVICDVGANIGFYSLWFSRLLPEKKAVVYAFEPSPSVVGSLKDNLSLNDATNVTVVPLACSDVVGEVDFFVGGHHHTSSLHEKLAQSDQGAPQKVTVGSTTLDHFFHGEGGREGPDLIKIDVEGGGTFVLKGCDRCVETKRPLFLIESHTPAEDQAISELLVRHDYHAYRINNRQWVEVLTDTFPNRRGVWGVMFLCPVELRRRLSGVLPDRDPHH